jgi:surface protein
MAKSFDSDLSSWNVARVTNMTRMFYNATSFNQSLCSWKDYLDADIPVEDMFQSTACIHTNDPIRVDQTSFPSFCAACQ